MLGRKEDLTPSELGEYQSYINNKIDQIITYADRKGASPEVLLEIKKRLDDFDVGEWEL